MKRGRIVGYSPVSYYIGTSGPYYQNRILAEAPHVRA